ncbi:Glycosyl phosphatidyl inositol protein transamidase complex subunit [Yamadazyma tenuis]|uniref:Glycosyl phosphatidyl inositol protein transamidase complex subunit n=1 Tax=Candida tenuis TaxID=2315449 RepID=UPI0027AB58B5|nr:Glycosyl phosphatidyl inositol protein transamidase complex subunit [Yamadazyma tenuis]
MALAETILRAVHKHDLVPKLTRALPWISLLFSFASVIWLLMLPIDGNYRKSYISENALMPGQVTSYFRESEWNIVRGYRNELKIFEGAAIDERNAVVEGWLKDIGLKTAYHRLHDPSVQDNMYAILHAARGDDTEAMVLSVPWTTSDGEYNLGGASLAVALARYFNRMSIWSKNIIIVFSEDGHKSLRSWVEAYHTSLDTTAGSIEAAIVLEYGGDSDYFEYYEMHYEGLNGQLPNLDLLNTANLVSYHENIHISIQQTEGEKLTRNDYLTRLKTFLKGIVSLTLAGIVTPSNGCESFSGWQIQAFTIKVKGTSGGNDITQIGRVVDETFRSVNNLLEKFHQSFFFYLMLGPRYFVSIGTYLPSAALIAASFALSSLSCMLNSGFTIPHFLLNISSVLKFFVMIELSSFLLSTFLPYLVKQTTDESDKISLVNLILLSMTSLVVALSSTPFTKHFYISKVNINSKFAFSMISFSLFFIAMVIVALLILNFSLALCIGLLAMPLQFVQQLLNSIEVDEFNSKLIKSSNPVFQAIENNKAKIKVFLCLFVSNPFFVVYITGGLYLEAFGYQNGTLNLMTGLLTSWDDVQCWTWFIVMLGWFPAWLSIAISCGLGDFKNQAPVSYIKKNQ